MAQDKKVKDGRIGFVLTRGIGQAFTPAYVELVGRRRHAGRSHRGLTVTTRS